LSSYSTVAEFERYTKGGMRKKLNRKMEMEEEKGGEEKEDE
jgi:hypothetical protein